MEARPTEQTGTAAAAPERVGQDRQLGLIHITTVPMALGFVSGHAAYMGARGLRLGGISSPGRLLDEFARREGVAVHAVPLERRITPGRDLVAIARLWRLLRQLRPVIVHAHTPKGGLLGMIASWLAGVPIRIYQIHGLPFITATGPKRALLRLSEWVSCKLASRIFCDSPSIRQVAIDEGFFPAAKGRVLGSGSANGVDAAGTFNPTSDGGAARRRVRAQFGIPNDALVIGYVGRIVRDKGLIELTHAWNELSRDFPDLHLLVVGPFEDQDPLPAETEHALKNDPRVHLPGHADEPAPFFAAMDLFAFPTYREGFGIVAIEAAAMELPVVGTQIPGCVDAVRDGVTGTLVPPRDAAALAGAIRRYLDDPELRRAHGRAGRERALREFRPEAIWEAMYEEYAGLLRRKRIELPAPPAGELVGSAEGPVRRAERCHESCS